MIRRKEELNRYLSRYEPTALVTGTALTVVSAYYIGKFISDPSGCYETMKKRFFSGLRYVPFVSGEIEKQREKALSKMRAKLKIVDDPHPYNGWPEEGVPQDEIIKAMEVFVERETPAWEDGRLSGKVYSGRPEVSKLISNVYAMFGITNALHPDVFPSIRKFEAETLRLTAEMLNGNEKTCGALTGGGTESILMAMKSYREYGQQVRGISIPEVIASESAHAAFDKAANYFGIKLVRVRCKDNGEADTQAMKAKINRNTIALVGSAPNYAQGAIDDIPTLSEIALKYNLLLHVDCCLGGFVLPWAKRLGYEMPDFDFSLEGVTSISCDTHKYGFGPKGQSVILFKDKELRKFMYFAATEWNGGIYASPTIAGSRPGGPIAATWAVLLSLGQKGFLSAAKQIMDARIKIEKMSEEIPGLEVICHHRSPVIAWKSDKFDIFTIADAMKLRGWVLDLLQRPNSIHLCVTLRHVGVEDEFINDLKWACERVQSHPEEFKEGLAPIYGMASELPDRSVIREFVEGYLDSLLDTM